MRAACELLAAGGCSCMHGWLGRPSQASGHASRTAFRMRHRLHHKPKKHCGSLCIKLCCAGPHAGVPPVLTGWVRHSRDSVWLA